MHEPATDNAAVPPHVQLITLTTAAWPGVPRHAGAGVGLVHHRAGGPGRTGADRDRVPRAAGQPGFWLTLVMPTASAVSVVEAVMA
jgi:hypothetical protein